MPLDKLMEMRSTGMTYKEIADELGIHKETVYRKLKNPDRFGDQHLCTEFLKWEDRWDLFDVNKTSEYLINSAATAAVGGSNA